MHNLLPRVHFEQRGWPMSRVVVGSGVLCVTWVWAAVAVAEGFQEPKGPRQVTNSIGMQFVLIPAGEFMMGAAAAEMGKRTDELPQHHVKISRPFWLGVHEVTQTEYEQVMGYHDSNSHRFAVRLPERAWRIRADSRSTKSRGIKPPNSAIA